MFEYGSIPAPFYDWPRPVFQRVYPTVNNDSTSLWLDRHFLIWVGFCHKITLPCSKTHKLQRIKEDHWGAPVKHRGKAIPYWLAEVNRDQTGQILVHHCTIREIQQSKLYFAWIQLSQCPTSEVLIMARLRLKSMQGLASRATSPFL